MEKIQWIIILETPSSLFSAEQTKFRIGEFFFSISFQIVTTKVTNIGFKTWTIFLMSKLYEKKLCGRHADYLECVS